MTNHIFDLDRTIWDCYDKHGNPIWAKQLLPPFSIQGDQVTDDVGSICLLRPGIKLYISNLLSSEHNIGYCSVGRVYNLPNKYQPSVLLLDLFKLDEFDPPLCFLGYKTDSKVDHLLSCQNCIFYDDDPKHQVALEPYDNVFVVNASTILDWSDFELANDC